MTSPHILFTPPLALRFAGQPVLQVVGQLPGYTAGLAYEGRLQIINYIGDCTVQWVSGAMPPGTTIRVDNATHEVVVEWPDYQVPDPNSTAVPNGSFEDGDTKWEKGAGWLIGSSASGDFDTYDGTWSAAYVGRGISSMTGTKVPVVVGTEITASIQVQQGASSKSNVSAVVLLCWYDALGNMIDYDAGNVVSSGSNGAWHISQVKAKAPAGSFYVALAANANRRRQNKRLWVDQARWNHSYPSGANSDDDYCLTLLVRDAAGREALWQGCVGERAIYFTTQIYPVDVVEELDALFAVDAGFLRTPPVIGYAEGADASIAFLGGEFRTPLQNYQMLPEGVDADVSMLSGEIRVIQRAYSMQAEGVDATLPLLSGTIKQVLIATTMTPEGVDSSMSILSGTLA